MQINFIINKSILVVFVIILFASLYFAQSNQIVPLSIGNKWIYNNHYYEQDEGTIIADYDYIQTKEIVGDTLIGNEEWKIVFVTSIYDTATTFKNEYWFENDGRFYVDNFTENLPILYDTAITQDTIWAVMLETFGVYLDTVVMWGEELPEQLWTWDWFMGASPRYFEDSHFVKNIGPTNYLIGGIGETTGNWSYFTSSIIKGAVIDGIVFGDTTVVIVKEENFLIPTGYLLSQNYPNPFNPTTTIKYQIPEISFVTIKVYDVLGNEIATLVSEEKPAGEYNVEFRIDNLELSSGIYFYQLRAGDYIETRKMVLMK